MAIQSNYAIAIAALDDRLKKSCVSFSNNKKQNQKHLNLVRAIFPYFKQVTCNC